MSPIITLCTDFGLRDAYVAAMKGAILSIAPKATLVDISHDLPRHAIRAAAYVIGSAAPFFSPDTVHLVVVDPGVGSSRRAIAVRGQRALYVAPDNGVLEHVLRADTAQESVALTNPQFWRTPVPSHTFHGRDIFAPVAAHIANGTPIGDMGKPVQDLVRSGLTEAEVDDDGRIRGQVVYIDTFGNLITDIAAQTLERCPHPRIVAGPMRLQGIVSSYAMVAPGDLLAIIGGNGYLEIAAREDSAARLFGLGEGSEIVVE